MTKRENRRWKGKQNNNNNKGNNNHRKPTNKITKGPKPSDLQTSSRTIRVSAASEVQISKWQAGKPKEKQSSTKWMIGCSSRLNHGIRGHEIRAQGHTTIRCLKRSNLKQEGKSMRDSNLNLSKEKNSSWMKPPNHLPKGQNQPR